MGISPGAVAFVQRENECEQNFAEEGPFWFVSAGELNRVIFCSEDDYKSARNATAVNVARSGVVCYMDTIMSNHGHWLFGRASLEKCMAFWSGFRRAIALMEKDKGLEGKDLLSWECLCKPVENLKYFRNICAYIARNAPLARMDATVSGYRWSSADLPFNSNIAYYDPGLPYSGIPFKEKRRICRGRNIELPENYKVNSGEITKLSYVESRGVERMFNSATQYWRHLNRQVETDMEIARVLGEKMSISDEELYNLVATWCYKDLYLEKGLRGASLEQKFTLAKRLHDDLGIANQQISRILELDPKILNRIYPIPE